MSRYFIENVDRGVTDDGVPGSGGGICASVRYRKDDDPSRWLTVEESGGFCTFYLDDEDRFAHHIDPGEDLESETGSIIDEFEGIDVGCDYEDIYDQLYDDQKDNPAGQLLRYIIAVTTCPKDELEGLKELAVGKYIDEVEVPICNAEQDYLDMREE